jgi:hypothetical protein
MIGGFTSAEFIAGAKRAHAMGITLGAAETQKFDRRLDEAAARNLVALESAFRAKRRAKILTSLVHELKDSSMHLQAAIELHRLRRAQAGSR